MSTPRLYDPKGLLPGPGDVLLLEASAGTGKTYAISKLVLRFIVDDVAALEQMLIMTFSRSAAAELRDRIRQELTSYARAGTGPADALERVRVAQSSFDAASIGTIHQACIDAFARLGIAADADPGEVIAEQVRDLVEQVLRDIYVAQYADAPPPPAGHDDPRLAPNVARALAKAVLASPDAQLAGLGTTTDPHDVQRLQIAERTRAVFPERQHDLGLLTFDDIVLRLAGIIGRNGEARRNLESRFKVVLVDEFQDTDPSQWAIVARAFAHRPDCRVVLIGDPKQGIYSFRGADIHSYAAARAHAHVQTLGVNYRSDRPVVDALMELMQGRNLGGKEPGSEIMVGEVTAHQIGSRIGDAPGGDDRRVRIRCLRPGPEAKAEAERLIASDVADTLIADLIAGRQTQTKDGSWRSVRPSDYAVIVRENKQAELVRSTLAERGVPAVINSRTTVFVSQAAADWAVLLAALEQPRPSSTRAAAITGFFGIDPADLATDREQVTAVIAGQLRTAAQDFAAAGVPGVMAHFDGAETAASGIAERMLRTADGERYLTDLRHVAALLHAEQRRARLGLAGLLAWLEQQRTSATSADSDERSESLVRRIDTDADAVQVVTIHASKGLQYPITYVPFGWGQGGGAGTNPVATVDGVRMIEVRKNRDAMGEDIKDRAGADAKAETLRMLYVALTRGISEVVIWWSKVKRNTTTSPLQRLISARATGHTLPRDSYPPMHDPATVFAHSTLIAVQDIGEPRELTWSGRMAQSEPGLQAAEYTRSRRVPGDPPPLRPIDTAWARPSFTALTRGADHRPGDADTDAAGVKDDELDAPQESAPQPAGAPAPPSPLAGIPGGAAVGDLVHRVLEHVDLDAPDLDADLLRSCTEELRRTPTAGLAPRALAEGLSPALRTPFGEQYAATSLADIANADRLAELQFELALGTAAPAPSVGDLGRIIAARAPEPWLADYGDVLADSHDISWRQLRGFLTGSIDALLRVNGRHIVVDYKSNVVGPRDGDVGHYLREPLRAAMIAAHYPLQALLYCIAVHRFLRWRMPGYDPAAHLGGVRYLFLRGMAGPGGPVADGWPTGVFGFDPGPALVLALDEAMGGGR